MESFPFQIPADAEQPSSAFLQHEQSNLKTKKYSFCYGESCEISNLQIFWYLLPLSEAYFYHISFFLNSILGSLVPFTSFSLPEFKYVDACTASSLTKCSSMLCYFSSHLPGLSFLYALVYFLTPSPLLRMPK